MHLSCNCFSTVLWTDTQWAKKSPSSCRSPGVLQVIDLTLARMLVERDWSIVRLTMDVFSAVAMAGKHNSPLKL